MSINHDLVDSTVERALILNRYSAGTGRKVVELLNDVQRDIIRRLPDITGEITRRRMLAQLKEIQGLIVSGYDDIAKLSFAELNELADIESLWQMNSINSAVGVEIMRSMPTAALESIVSTSLVEGLPSADWWSRQSQNAQFEFSRVVRLGMSQSETNQQIARRVRDMMGVQQRHAFALVKTSTQAVAMQARDEMLAANDDVVKGKISVATLDSHTTFLCADCDGATYNLQNDPIEPKKRPYIPIPRHFNCLTGDTLVSAVCGVSGISKRWFDGNVFVIHTASGAKFTCTPNHPVLTDRGWVAASLIAVGDTVFNCVDGERKAVIDGDNENIESTIHDVFESLASSGKMRSMPVPLSSEDFHGDSSDKEVAVVLTNSFLWSKFYPFIGEAFGKLSFIGRSTIVSFLLNCFGLFFSLASRSFSAFAGSISSCRKNLPFFDRAVFHSGKLLFRSISLLKAVFNKYFFNNARRNIKNLSDSCKSLSGIKKLNDLVIARSKRVVIWLINTRLNKNFTHCIAPMWDDGSNILNSHAGIIKADNVISVRTVNYSGHVYNLETNEGWYCANGIITHNCRSMWTPLLKTWDEMGLPFGEFNSSTRASLDGQIPVETKFDAFLGKKSESWQDKYLGKGRAKMYRDGKITLSDLVDGNGRELTLAQLREL